MGAIRDGTAGSEIATNAIWATSAWARTRGLMLRRPLEPGEGLVIRPCGSIHMMFMRFAIDAVFFDKDGRVTRVSRNVRPWIGFAFGGRGAKGVIELPRGGAERVAPGHYLELSP